MKVVVLKSYEKRSEVSYNYGNDYETVYHNFEALEKVMELSADEYNELLCAITHFNSKKKSEYTLKAVVIMENDEVNSLFSDFRKYKEEEAVKHRKLVEANAAKTKAARIKREEAKAERALKKLAKDLNLSVDAVREKLAK